jgi:cytochrome c553
MQMSRLRYVAAIFAILMAKCLTPAPAVAQESAAGEHAAVSPQTTPFWAYPTDPPGEKFVPMLDAYLADSHQTITDKDAPIQLSGVEVKLSLNQVRQGLDWNPSDHPPMPDIVARGRRPAVLGCSFCHVPNGRGRVESSPLAGLPVAYMKEQFADFKNGARISAEPRLVPPTLMQAIAKNVTDEEVDTAVKYFASFSYKPWVRVVESATAPKTRLAGGILIPVEPQVMEPIGSRIIEVPESVQHTAFHDSESGFVAYVPPGSIKQGELLATTGGAKVAGGKIVPGKTIQCSICHGADLKGLGNVPGIAGSIATYTFRQLYDYQKGTRNGKGAELMKPVVKNLSQDDLIALVAYVSSRKP